MPTSDYRNIPTIIELIRKLDPESILDVGIGFGKYGFLIREHLDGFGLDRHTVLEGVEAHPPYLDRSKADYLYDTVWEGDFLEVFQGEDRSYELVLMIDIIEHYEKHRGLEALYLALQLAPRVLIATPRQFLEQGAVHGNDYERHLSHWTEADFAEFDWQDYGNEATVLGIVSRKS